MMKACQGAAVAAVAAAALLAGGDARSVNDASIAKTISLPLFHERGTPLPSTRRLADSVQQVNRRALNDGNGTSIAAGGDIWPVGVYWTTIEVGTPPKEFAVAIDSGSGFLDIEGASCQGCNKKAPNGQYDPKASSTGKRTFPFVFSNTYETCDLSDITAPCTISGSFYTDKVSLAGLGPVDVTMGVINKITTNFDQFKFACGVMGFTGTDKKNVFSQLVSAGLAEDKWAICLAKGSKSNGTLTIGGVDERLIADGAELGLVKNVAGSATGFYSVAVPGGITLNGTGGKPIDGIDNHAAILDTGTNVLLLPDQAFDSLRARYQALCDEGAEVPGLCGLAQGETLFDGKCLKLSDEDIGKWPALNFGLDNGVELTMNANDLLLRGDVRAVKAGDKDLVCLGVRKTGSGSNALFIIGDSLMRNYYLVFDRADDKIGWAEVSETCGEV